MVGTPSTSLPTTALTAYLLVDPLMAHFALISLRPPAPSFGGAAIPCVSCRTASNAMSPAGMLIRLRLPLGEHQPHSGQFTGQHFYGGRPDGRVVSLELGAGQTVPRAPIAAALRRLFCVTDSTDRGLPSGEYAPRRDFRRAFFWTITMGASEAFSMNGNALWHW
jgi:hypothetical protein